MLKKDQTFPPLPIRIKNLWKSFHGGRDQVLKNISVHFPAGKLTYILGPSGTGKSVLIKHILGLLKPDRGSVWIGDTDITKLRGRALAKYRLVFGMLFQNAALFDDMSIYENVAFPLREHSSLSGKEIHKKVTSTLQHLGLKTGHQKFPNELSGGMKKRVGLARAIIRKPSVLLYDEPTTGLDPETRVTVDDLIETLKRELKVTSLVISHDLPSALRLADHIAFLHQGKLLFFGTASEFKKETHPKIRAFFEAEKKSTHNLIL